MEQMIQNTINYITDYFKDDYSGHDLDHTLRVYRMAQTLAAKENADLLIVSLAALLHDVDDRKLSPETYEHLDHARAFMAHAGLDQEIIDKVCHIIKQVSFSGTDSLTPDTIEGMCVQDADRLDAMGAIGIARAFSFGGYHHRKMYDPDILPLNDMDAKTYFNHTNGTTINHFYEKLLLLKDMMNTKAAKDIAQKRHDYMVIFLDEFKAEYYGER
ncbi:MAG: HD domain-containing protein [Erysipelotrichaceae bacterium]|nr:HD domain-containing protein [Erysipelotrichaceae bacterium]